MAKKITDLLPYNNTVTIGECLVYTKHMSKFSDLTSYGKPLMFFNIVRKEKHAVLAQLDKVVNRVVERNRPHHLTLIFSDVQESNIQAVITIAIFIQDRS